MNMKKMTIFLFTALVVFFVSSSIVMAQDSEGEKLNINTATIEQLSVVPGLNSELAQKIIDYRNDMGDITEMDELLDVDGFSDEILEEIKDKVGVEGIEGSDCTC